jgi:ribosomal-protein-alanine N-acetyltransferase
MNYQNIIFETERLIVKQYVFETDAENFFLINGDEEVMRFIRAPKSREECDEFLKQNIESYKINPLMGRWAVHEKRSGIYIGSFAFIPVEGTDDSQLGYAILKDYWGNGFATELTKEGVRYVFSKTNLNEIYGLTESQNIDSQKVLLKAGFRLNKTYTQDDKEVCSFIITRNDLNT